jgi:hypothetical protein
MEDSTKQNLAGYTPFEDDDRVYFNKEGKNIPLKDKEVYITGDAFDMCNDAPGCIAGFMAHEAVHSWVEIKIEQNSTTNAPRTKIEYQAAEELLGSYARSGKRAP